MNFQQYLLIILNTKNYLSTEFQQIYYEKMEKIGVCGVKIFLAILKRNPYDWNRIICGILSLIKSYPCEIVNLACEDRKSTRLNSSHT